MQFRRWSVVFLVCAAVTLLLGGYKFLQIRAAIAFAESFPEHSESVETDTVRESEWTETLTALGEVVAPKSVELRNELEGRISAVDMPPGGVVKQGQVLLRLDTSEENAQLRGAEAEAELARLALERYGKLITRNASSKDQYDQARAQHAVALARIQALRATIDKKTLIAPFDARVGLHQLEPGQFLAADSLITTLVGMDEDVWVDFPLPQQEAGLPLGAPVLANARELLPGELKGEVIARSSAIEQSSRNLMFRAVLRGAASRLTPGSLVNLSIEKTHATRGLLVPGMAARQDIEGTYVFVIRPGQDKQLRAYRQPVVLGPAQGKRVLVRSGLRAGDLIAVDGAYKLRDGMLVRVKSEDAATAGAAR